MSHDSAPIGPYPARGRTTGWRRLVLPLGMAVVLAASCTTSSAPSDRTSRPSSGAGKGLITGVEVHPAPHSKHIPIVTVQTSASATVTVTATSGDHKVVTPVSKAGKAHEVPILGLRTDRDYRLSVTATSGDGVADRSATAHYRTPPLPSSFPKLTVRTHATKQVSPGITLIPLISGASGALTDPEPNAKPSRFEAGRVIGVDATGEVVWYYESKLEVISVEPTSHGTLLLGIDAGTLTNLDGSVREIDLLGNTLAEWSTKIARKSGKSLPEKPLGPKPIVSVDIDSVHHDVHELPNGNIIALSTQLIPVAPATGAKLCPANPPTHIVADVVVEFERTGKVVGTWPVAPLFDPVTRPGSDMCPKAPDERSPEGWLYPQVAGERDWTHANAIALDEAHNTLVVSLREVDAVVGLRYHADQDGPAGERLWELGPYSDLKMQGSGLFQYHQHGIDVRPDGTLLVFDNGNLRPGTKDAGGTQPNFSRAVIYKIDPAAGTVSQVWEHRDENPWGGPMYVPFMGDADPLANGDVLITYAVFADKDVRPHARIVEVDPDLDGGGAGDKVVFDLIIGGQEGAGWVAYHSARLPSLYPAP